MQTLRRKTASEKGFTLVELMIALGLSSVVMGAGFALFLSSHRVSHSNSQDSITQQIARASLDIMTEDLIMAGFGTLDPALVGTDEGEMVFTVNTVDKKDATDTIAFKASIGAMSIVAMDADLSDLQNSDPSTGGAIVNERMGHDSFQQGMPVDILSPGRERIGSGVIGNLESADANRIVLSSFSANPDPNAPSNVLAGSFFVQRPMYISYAVHNGTLYRCAFLTSEACEPSGGKFSANLNRTPTAANPETVYALAENVADLQLSYLTNDSTTGYLGADWTKDPADYSDITVRKSFRAVKVEVLFKSAGDDPMITEKDCSKGNVKKNFYLGNRDPNQTWECGYAYTQMSKVVRLPNMMSYSAGS